MNLYLLERETNHGWDTYLGFVIAAKSSRDARKIADKAAGKCDGLDWTSPRQASCHKVGTADRTEADVVLSSFNAG